MEEVDWEAIDIPLVPSSTGIPQTPFTPGRLLRWWTRLISPQVERGITDHAGAVFPSFINLHCSYLLTLFFSAHVAGLMAGESRSTAKGAKEGSDSADAVTSKAG